MSFSEIFAASQQITITTFPVLPLSTVATNYTNLQIISTITGSDSLISCHWVKDGRSSNFYNEMCLPNEKTANYSSDCQESGSTVTINYTIYSAMFADVDYEVSCFFPDSVFEVVNFQVRGAK